MKHTLSALAIVAFTSLAPTAHADQLSISVGQPGFYGHIDIGGYPAPQLIYQQPMVIQPAAYAAAPQYLYAPPKHVKNWKKYCRQYGACGTPVYFVQQGWYNRVYVPEYRHRHGHGRHEGYGPHGDRDWDERRGNDKHRHGHGHRHHDD